MNRKILHLFQWDIKDIINNLDEIKNSGWTSILISPVQPKTNEDNKAWWSNYQIKSLSIKDEEMLYILCNKAHRLGLEIFVDVIVTHFGNDGKMNSLNPANNVDKQLTNNKWFWREKKQINYNDRWSITHHCNGLPSINTDNYDYQDLVIEFFNRLIELGVDGLRLDSAKMIGLPEEYGDNFFIRVLQGLTKEIFIFGEVIFESNYLIQKYEKYINVLNEFNKNSYELDKNKTVVFIESHDSFLDTSIGYTSSWSEEKILNEYKYINRDFNNVLFYSRPFSEVWKCANK